MMKYNFLEIKRITYILKPLIKFLSQIILLIIDLTIYKLILAV